MNHHFKIKVSNQPAALERLLRVVRHRGFRLTNLNAEIGSQDFEIQLAVDGSRSIHLLSNQLEKLFDVKALSLQSSLDESLYQLKAGK